MLSSSQKNFLGETFVTSRVHAPDLVATCVLAGKRGGGGRGRRGRGRGRSPEEHPCAKLPDPPTQAKGLVRSFARSLTRAREA